MFPATRIPPPKDADYSEGSWTPAWTGLTVVGSPTYSATYTRIGRLVIVQVIISNSVGNTTASTLGTTYINNLPFTAANEGTALVVNVISGATSAGYIQTGRTRLFTPTWTASIDHIYITAFMEV